VKRKPFERQETMGRFLNLGRNRIGHEWIALSIAFLLIIVGCEGGKPPSSLPAKTKSLSAEKKEAPAKATEKKEPEKKEEAEYSYNPAGKPDPFKPFIQSASRGSRTAPATPLQKFDISQLKLVAIISTSDGNIALVEDATGKGYFLRKGTWVGKNDGKVTKILKDTVIIQEVYQDIFGQTKTSEISLSLHKVEEGGES
jgi:type IV pilus assembly protein PilP